MERLRELHQKLERLETTAEVRQNLDEISRVVMRAQGVLWNAKGKSRPQTLSELEDENSMLQELKPKLDIGRITLVTVRDRRIGPGFLRGDYKRAVDRLSELREELGIEQSGLAASRLLDKTIRAIADARAALWEHDRTAGKAVKR